MTVYPNSLHLLNKTPQCAFNYYEVATCQVMKLIAYGI